MFGASSISGSNASSSAAPTLFSSATVSGPVSQTTTQFGDTNKPATVLPSESSGGSAADMTNIEATTGTSLKGLLEKEGSVSSACSQLLSMMNADTEISFSDLSAITQKMTLDLAADERAFLNCLLELNAYDRQLWENMQRITEVETKLTTLEEKQSKMMYNMSCIDEEQKALDIAVNDMEKSLGLPDWTDQSSELPMDSFSATPSDVKRQQLLQLLISVDSQIKEADCDLQEIVDQVTALHNFKTTMSNTNRATEDQVAQILKNQMETLLYIDNKTAELDAKVEDFKEVLEGRNATTSL